MHDDADIPAYGSLLLNSTRLYCSLLEPAHHQSMQLADLGEPSLQRSYLPDQIPGLLASQRTHPPIVLLEGHLPPHTRVPALPLRGPALL